MILLVAVFAGAAAGLLRVQMNHRPVELNPFRLEWLVPLAFIPQLVAFQLPLTRQYVSDDWARAALVSSQALLLIFAWANRKAPGAWALGIGLLLNFAVIVLNGGWMPVSPETVSHYLPGGWQVGQRLAAQKDIILPVSQTRLWWLSDRFTLPDWAPSHVAFSIGDIIIAIGAFLLLWSMGAAPRKREEIL